MSDSLTSELEDRIKQLEAENEQLKVAVAKNEVGSTVTVPDEIKPIFSRMEQIVADYFSNKQFRPGEGTITINDERYVLLRASSLSYEFLNKIKDLYADRGEAEAMSIGRNFLFDVARVIGLEDAKVFHDKMNLKDPVEKLSAGPIHFAYSGWAFVDILPESNPTPDDNYFLKYHHPYSFEADSWLKAGVQAKEPVCIMNAGYSSGWCEASFGIPLTAVEIECKACGDDNCTFIMAPPHKIDDYLAAEDRHTDQNRSYDVPVFFQRKHTEEQIKASLKEKDLLIKEIHHRVKNNLQIISSLLKLESSFLEDAKFVSRIEVIQNRIKTMALVHEKLYQSDVQTVNGSDYVRSVVEMASLTFDTGKDIETVYDFPDKAVYINIDMAISLGLIVNEIISNCYKHAFDVATQGTINVSCVCGDTQFVLSIADNGRGLPENFDLNNPSTFGTELIQMLTTQINGTLTTANGTGTKFTLTVPL